jgi:hypothetical protein
MGALSAPGSSTNEGTGLRWATAALDRGDLVAALVCNPASVRELADTYGAVPSVAAEVTGHRNPSLERTLPMGEELLDLAIATTGGQQLWKTLRGLRIDISIGGPIWAMKGWPPAPTSGWSSTPPPTASPCRLSTANRSRPSPPHAPASRECCATAPGMPGTSATSWAAHVDGRRWWSGSRQFEPT